MDKQFHTDELLAELLPNEAGDTKEDRVAEETTVKIPAAVTEDEEDVKIFTPVAKEQATKALPSIGMPLDEPEEEPEETASQLCFDEWDEAADKEERERREKEEQEAEMEEHLKTPAAKRSARLTTIAA